MDSEPLESGGIADAPKRRWPTRLLFGMGGMPIALMQDVPGLFISPFLLEQALLSPVSVGNMFLVAKLFDAITDPLVGVLTDRTRSKRFGRRKPWMFAALLLAILSNTLLWLPLSTDLSEPLRAFYHTVFLCLLALSLTLFLIPYSAMTTEVTLEDAERLRLTEARSAFNFVGIMLGVMVVGLVVDELLAHAEFGAYFVANVGVTVLIATGIIAVMVGVKPRYEVTDMGPASTRSMREEFVWTLRALREIVVQREYWTLSVVASTNWVAIFCLQNNLYLYMEYCVALPSYFTPVMVVALLSSLAWVFIWRIITRWRGKRTALLLGQAATFVTYIFVTVAPRENVAFCFMVAIFTGMSLSSVNLMPWLLLPDVIDYDEHRSGERREGASTSFFVFFNKVAIGIALSASGFILAAGGYDNSGGAPEHTQQIERTLRLLCGVIPAVLSLIVIPAIFAYPITAEGHELVILNLAERRAADDEARVVARDVEGRPLIRASPAVSYDGDMNKVGLGDGTMPPSPHSPLPPSSPGLVVPPTAASLAALQVRHSHEDMSQARRRASLDVVRLNRHQSLSHQDLRRTSVDSRISRMSVASLASVESPRSLESGRRDSFDARRGYIDMFRTSTTDRPLSRRSSVESVREGDDVMRVASPLRMLSSPAPLGSFGTLATVEEDGSEERLDQPPHY